MRLKNSPRKKEGSEDGGNNLGISEEGSWAKAEKRPGETSEEGREGGKGHEQKKATRLACACGAHLGILGCVLGWDRGEETKKVFSPL